MRVLKQPRTPFPASELALTGAIVILSLFIEPILTGNQDAPGYLDRMQGYLDHGISWRNFREPLFPLFLTLLTRLGLPIASSLPLVQNLLFLGTLTFFLRALFGRSTSPVRPWRWAAGITLIPTFLIPLNGAAYTESISTSLVFVFLGTSIRFYFSPRCLWERLVWACLGAVATIALDLTKGSFVYMHLGFPFLFLGAQGALGLLKGPAARKPLAFSTALLGMALIGRLSIGLWFGLREGESAWSTRQYERGGAVLLGRTGRADNFDFARESVPFLLQALSEEGCRKLIGPVCDQYGFGSEESEGRRIQVALNLNDGQMMSEGIRLYLKSPFRQTLYGAFVLVRFVLHHSTTGFARLKLPILGDLVHSFSFLVLLKVFNLALYLYIPTQLFLRRRDLKGLRAGLRRLPPETRMGTVLYIAYATSLLAVHSLVWNVVRMAYPVAPLLVILNGQARIFFKERE